MTSTPAPTIQHASMTPYHDRNFHRTVTRVNPLTDPDWDEKLEAFPAASIFHTAAWARVLHATYGFKPLGFATTDAGRFNSVVPMAGVENWLTGRRGVSLPFTDSCEPLCRDREDFTAHFKSALEYATEHRWKSLEFRGADGFLPEDQASVSYYGHRVALDADEKVLFERCGSAVRRAIRRSEKSGLTIERGSGPEFIKEFYELHCRTRKKHGVPPQPYAFFHSIATHVTNMGLGFVLLARNQGVPVAGAVFLHFGSKAIYKFGASDERYQHTRANNLIMWEAIRWLATRGFTELHLGRTSTHNSGLRQFKLGWGALEDKIHYFRYDLRQREFVRTRDKASGWHTRICSHLPIPVLRLMGRVLYRHIV